MERATNEMIEGERRIEQQDWRPRNCVWELTLACNLRCRHCGSRAGEKREKELSTGECLNAVAQLAELGCELITLSGGEPTLRKDWDQIARAIASRNIYVNMVTNGVYPSDSAAKEVAARARDAGLCNVGVSLDGPREVHEQIRGANTYDRTLGSIGQFRAAGLNVTVLTTVGQFNLRRLEEVRRIAINAGAASWRVQLAKPMGAMADRRDLVLRPRQILELVPWLARLKREKGINVQVGDSIGYYGPHDKVLRGWGWRARQECWQGCQAGLQAIGIEADGGVKGCLSLQAKFEGRDPFIEGNLRGESLADIWRRPGAFAYNRDFTVDALTGPCQGCRYGWLCRGGAHCMAAASSGTLTENDFCFYHLASQERGRRQAVLAQSAAAAALTLWLGQTGCADLVPESKGSVSDATTPDSSPTQVPDGAPVSRDAARFDAFADTSMVGDVAVLPDAAKDTSIIKNEAAASVDAAAKDAAADAEHDAATGTDSGTPINCQSVCCTCDYGIIPDQVWEACCAPDPCADVCCACLYGVIPEELRKQCC